jgi:hypothetical protein
MQLALSNRLELTWLLLSRQKHEFLAALLQAKNKIRNCTAAAAIMACCM